MSGVKSPRRAIHSLVMYVTTLCLIINRLCISQRRSGRVDLCKPHDVVSVMQFDVPMSRLPASMWGRAIVAWQCANGWAQCEHTPNVGRPFVGRLQCAGSECHVSSFNCSSWLQDLSWRVVSNVDCMCEMFLT